MTKANLDDIISLCKRRGFVYPGSEIYGGEAGLYDFGPYGVELLNNIKRSWWRANVHKKENYVGIDAAMFKNPKVWVASGHVGGFADPLAECKNCHTRIRACQNLSQCKLAYRSHLDDGNACRCCHCRPTHKHSLCLATSRKPDGLF